MRISELPKFINKPILFGYEKKNNQYKRGVLIGYDADQGLCLIREDTANGRVWHDVRPSSVTSVPTKYTKNHPEKDFRYAQTLQNRARI